MKLCVKEGAKTVIADGFDPLFEDNHVLVLNKPAGLLTQPSGTNDNSLEAVAKAYIKERDHKPGNVFLGAVHRLDRSVSGVVVFGKTSKALSRLSESIREKETKKIYWALVESQLPSNEGVLEHYLFHDDFSAKIVKSTFPGAKLAVLHYRLVEKLADCCLVEVELKTGRYHQIRAQLSFIGCPILGDDKYGSRRAFKPGAIALHHKRMELVHPVSKEQLVLEAPLPF